MKNSHFTRYIHCIVMLGLLAPTTLVFGQQAWHSAVERVKQIARETPKRALARTTIVFKSGRMATINRLNHEYRLVITGSKAALKRMKGKILSPQEKKDLTGFAARTGALITLIAITTGLIWLKKRKRDNGTETVFGPHPETEAEREVRLAEEKRQAKAAQEQQEAQERLEREKEANVAQRREELAQRRQDLEQQKEQLRLRREKKAQEKQEQLLRQQQEEAKQRKKPEETRQERERRERMERRQAAQEKQRLAKKREEQGRREAAELQARLQRKPPTKKEKMAAQMAAQKLKKAGEQYTAKKRKQDKKTRKCIQAQRATKMEVQRMEKAREAKKDERLAQERAQKFTADKPEIITDITEEEKEAWFTSSHLGEEAEHEKRMASIREQQKLEQQPTPPAPTIEYEPSPKPWDPSASILGTLGAGIFKRRQDIGEDEDNDNDEEFEFE